MSQAEEFQASIVKLALVAFPDPVASLVSQFGRDPQEVTQWFVKRPYYHLPDAAMTFILTEAERLKDTSEGWKKSVPRALEAFWEVVEAYERDPGRTLPFFDRDALDRESVPSRFTRFTNHGWLANLQSLIARIPARRRSEFFREVFILAQKYAKD